MRGKTRKQTDRSVRYARFLIGIPTVFFVCCNSSNTELPAKPGHYGVNRNSVHLTADSTPKDTGGTKPDLLTSDHIGGIKIGQSLTEVEKLIGVASSRDPIQNWGADGRWYATYYFPRMGLSLNMGSDDSACFKPVVSSITASSSCPFHTARGITIGSSVAQVRDAYFAFIDNEQSNDTVVLAGSLYGGMIFEFEKGKVKKIFLGAAAE